MNASLVTGGGKWIVIPVEMRDRYMKSLETTSVDGKIKDFISLLLSL